MAAAAELRPAPGAGSSGGPAHPGWEAQFDALLRLADSLAPDAPRRRLRSRPWTLGSAPSEPHGRGSRPAIIVAICPRLWLDTTNSLSGTSSGSATRRR